jgi:hypothetical protein
VRKLFAFVVVVCGLTVGAYGWQARQTPATPGASAPTVDDVLKAFRADLQEQRSDIIAKNVTLTADQAAKFWPAYQQYQQEQNVIMDEQLKSVQKYVDTYETLSDADAVALMDAHFDRDARMNTLRQKWLGEFQKVLPGKLAARVMQIDRRLSLVGQIEISSRIPLIH